MSTTTLRILSAKSKPLSNILHPGDWLRIPEPDEFVVRLPEKPTPNAVRELFRRFSYTQATYLSTTIKIAGKHPKGKLLAAAVGGLLLGSYRSDSLKTERTPHPLGTKKSRIEVGKVSAKVQQMIRHERILANVQARVMKLVDAPANHKRPQDLAAWALASGKKYGYQVKVLDKAACEQENLGGLLAVNRGSEDPARFIVMEYRGEGAPDDAGPIAIIGKGITFDTGGISIKPSTNLHLMKSDMGGAAATFGTLEAAARLSLPVHLIGIVPSTDNSVDALSIKPSDVITGHSGKSIEIIDTDAEGRLVMSDGLSYANANYSPAVLIDVATLTGSAVRTFGYECAAMMSKNEGLVKAFRKAGDACGERVWPLPGWDSFDALRSDVADIKNYSGRPIHGAIDAFKFLEFFTDNHPAYVHFDIAGVALKQGPFAKDRQATGFGVRLFVEWLETQA
ncbi:MAG: leucyl aminopeptidase family protein [Bacteroidota bacterium]